MRRRGPLAGLLAAQAVSLSGNVVTLVALPLYVLSTTGSATSTGLTGVVATLPVVLGGALGGVVVDRLGHRRASVLADLVSGLTIGLVPLLDLTVGLPFWALLALVFTSGLLDAPGQSARQALLPEVAADAGVPIERAVSWLEAAGRGARVAGAPLAGLGVAVLGPLALLAVDALSFLVSALLVARCVPPAVAAHAGAVAPQGYLADLLDGLRFVAREPVLRAVVLLVLVTNALDAAGSSVLLPVYADRELGGGAALGLLIGAMAAGALAGNLLYGALGHRLPRRLVLVVAFTLAGGPPWLALAADPGLGVLAVVFAASGLCAGAVNPLLGAVELERVPASARARVDGLLVAGCFAAMPVGALGAGFAVEHAGLRPTLIAVGAAYVVVTLTPLLGGAWRGLERPAPEPVPA